MAVVVVDKRIVCSDRAALGSFGLGYYTEAVVVGFRIWTDHRVHCWFGPG